jgi:transcription termination/antitermination protein NusG
MTDNDQLKWYVVNTHSGFENKAREALLARVRTMGVQDKFGDILVPVETVKNGQKKTTRKFFPGYILVQMELTDHTWHVVKDTPKISGFVGNGQKPVPMPASEIDSIRKSMEKSETKPNERQALVEGDQVRVTDGPFSNFNGVVEQVDPDKGRLRVLVSIFGRVVPVELESKQVERVSG